MSALRLDLVLATRNLLKHPGVNGLAVLTLALAMGSATAVFTLVHTALWRPLPFESPERLVALFRHDLDRDEPQNPTTPADFLDWKRESHALTELTAARPFGPVLSGDGSGPALRLAGLKTTGSLFTLLGTKPLLGRVFDETDAEGGERVVVVSHALAQRVLGGAEEAVGQSVRLDGEDYRVIGVMPPSFFFPAFWATEAELWTPFSFSPEEQGNRGAQYLRVFGRLVPESSLEAARAEMAAVAERLQERYPETNREAGIHLEPLREPAVGSRRLAYSVLLGAVGLVLLIACANTANLLLVRALGREREMAVRLALGAGRGRLVRQMLVESATLAALATGLGLLLSIGFVRASPLVTASLPFPAEPRVDVSVLLFTLALSVTTTLLFGLAPALRASRSRFETHLRSRMDRRGAAVSSSLVAGEVALALALVVSAFVFIESFLQVSRVDPGFERERLLALELSLTGTSHTEPERQALLYEAIEARVSSLPGIEAASLVNHLPIGGDLWRMGFTVDGREAGASSTPLVAAHRTVGPRYFESMGIVLLAGRAFDTRDRENTERVVIVNETLAARYFPGSSAVGKSLRLGRNETAPRATIVGVVRDTRQWALTDPVRPEILFPFRQNPSSFWLRATLVVKSALPPEALEPSVRSAVAELDPALPVAAARTLDGILSTSLAEPRFRSALMAGFAGTALFLSLGGIYGVMALSVRNRRREIGLRMALGASPLAVRLMIVRHGLGLTLKGVAVGSILAIGLGRVLSGLVPEMNALPLPALALCAALVLTTGALASFLPARQASALAPRRVILES